MHYGDLPAKLLPDCRNTRKFAFCRVKTSEIETLRPEMECRQRDLWWETGNELFAIAISKVPNVPFSEQVSQPDLGALFSGEYGLALEIIRGA